MSPTSYQTAPLRDIHFALTAKLEYHMGSNLSTPNFWTGEKIYRQAFAGNGDGRPTGRMPQPQPRRENFPNAARCRAVSWG